MHVSKDWFSGNSAVDSFTVQDSKGKR